MKPAFLDSPEAWTRTPRTSISAAEHAAALHIVQATTEFGRWVLAGLALTAAVGVITAWALDLFPRIGG